MARASIFKNHTSQAVRLAKAVALPDGVKEVEVTVVGAARLIAPVDRSWDAWFDGEGVSDDFMVEREQPAVPGRRAF